MSVLLVVSRNFKCHWSVGPTRLSRGHVAKVHETRTALAGGLAAPPLPPQPLQPSTRASSPELLRLERRGRRARGWRGASELSGSEELLRALCACVVQAIVVIGQPRWAGWGGSARARGPVREGGDLGHARGARGRPVARLACRSAHSALFEPVSRSSSSETSTLRRSAQSAWPTRTRPRRELRSEVLHNRRSVSVAPASAGGQRKVGGATGRPRRLAYSLGDAGRCCMPRGVAREAPWVARSA